MPGYLASRPYSERLFPLLFAQFLGVFNDNAFKMLAVLAVIGSGSVVTRNIPAGVVAAGNPCRVLRTIGEEDRVRWQTAERDYDGVPEPR